MALGCLGGTVRLIQSTPVHKDTPPRQLLYVQWSPTSVTAPCASNTVVKSQGGLKSKGWSQVKRVASCHKLTVPSSEALWAECAYHKNYLTRWTTVSKHPQNGCWKDGPTGMHLAKLTWSRSLWAGNSFQAPPQKVLHPTFWCLSGQSPHGCCTDGSSYSTLGAGDREGVRVEPLSCDEALLPWECLRGGFMKLLLELLELLGEVWEGLGNTGTLLVKAMEKWSLSCSSCGRHKQLLACVQQSLVCKAGIYMHTKQHRITVVHIIMAMSCHFSSSFHEPAVRVSKPALSDVFQCEQNIAHQEAAPLTTGWKPEEHSSLYDGKHCFSSECSAKLNMQEKKDNVFSHVASDFTSSQTQLDHTAISKEDVILHWLMVSTKSLGQERAAAWTFNC